LCVEPVPTVYAGRDQIYESSLELVELRGSVVSAGLTPADEYEVSWSLVSGPDSAVIENSDSLTTSVVLKKLFQDRTAIEMF